MEIHSRIVDAEGHAQEQLRRRPITWNVSGEGPPEYGLPRMTGYTRFEAGMRWYIKNILANSRLTWGMLNQRDKRELIRRARFASIRYGNRPGR